MTAPNISQNTVSRLRGLGLIGMLVFQSQLNEIRTVLNKTPQAAQVDTYTVTAAVDSTLYTVTINGRAVTINSGVGSTLTSIATALAAAINADPIVHGAVTATSAVAIGTVTAGYPGISFTITVGANLATASVTATASADAIPFGRAVMRTSFDQAQGGYEMLGGLTKASLLTAQVDTLTVVYAAAERYYVNIVVAGVLYVFDVNANTDTATTASDIAAAINAAGRLPANTVLAAAGATTVTLTAEVPGQAFVASIGTESAVATNLSIAHTTAGTDLASVLVGVAMYAYDEEIPLGSSDASYPGNAGARVLAKGNIFVESTGTANPGDAVYVETLAGANSGKFYTSASATRVFLPPTLAKWSENGGLQGDTGTSLNVLQLAAA